MHQHVEDTIVVLNEGPGYQPRYNQYNMFIPRGEIPVGNLGPTICKRGAEKKCCCLASTIVQVAAGT